MRRSLCILPLLLFPLGATTVSDTIYTPFVGTLFNGTVTIECPRTLTVGRLAIAKGRKAITVKDGQFSVSIQPYTTSNPPGTCSVFYSSPTDSGVRISWSERWLIPDTNVVQRIKDVRK